MTIPRRKPPVLPGQVVLVLQGGGALGACQWGVCQALHEAGIEPAWVIGTSIGAISAALIAANPVARRLASLDAFWRQVEQSGAGPMFAGFGLPALAANLRTVMHGIPGFFEPTLPSPWGLHAPVGVDRAAFYTTARCAGAFRQRLASRRP